MSQRPEILCEIIDALPGLAIQGLGGGFIMCAVCHASDANGPLEHKEECRLNDWITFLRSIQWIPTKETT